ncbi:MAG: hypothetical protein QOE97_2940 [Pseudonocardiales bacterium]|jgi:hypothetical protein|nr:hypothetical protein [Pseudonocardiales bacterium]
MSRISVVRYTTTPQSSDENERLVAGVYAALAAAQPDGFRYATLRLPDEHGFVHLAAHTAEVNPLSELPAFLEFQRELGARVIEAPVARPAVLIGNYGLLAP